MAKSEAFVSKSLEGWHGRHWLWMQMVFLMANLQTPACCQQRSLALLSIALGTNGSGEEHQRAGTHLSSGMKLSHGKGHHLMAGHLKTGWGQGL